MISARKEKYGGTREPHPASNMRVLFVTNGHFDCALPLLRHLSSIADCTLNVQIECNEFQESICDISLKHNSVGVDVRDSDTEVIEQEVRPLVGSKLDISFTKYPSRSFRDPRNWRVSRKWVWWATRNRFDIVNYNGTSMLYLQQILMDQRSQKVFTIHDHVNHLGETAPQVRWLYRYMAWRQRHRFIAQSDFVRYGFSSEYDVNLGRIGTVRFGALELFRNWDDFSIVEEPATVLFFGRISPYKGLEYLAQAWKDVRNRVPGARLIIAGKGNMYFDATELKADHSVEIINRHIENAELARFMRRSSVVVIPYVEATQSGVVMTAYAFGKPVVATSVGGIPEVVEEGETGYIVPPKDSVRLADALVRVLSDSAMRQQMRKNIEHKISTEFSWERIARQTLAEYHLSLGKPVAPESQNTSTIPESVKKPTHIVNVVGARPNFMKVAPLFRQYAQYPEKIQATLVHTGQHYDDTMSEVFFTDLQLPKPHFNLGVGSGSHAEQTAKVMVAFEKVMLQLMPDLVVVVGDVNSTLACSLVAAKMNVKVAHVEAGLRSFDRSMPEEINRLVTDSISDFLFVTSPDAEVNLLREGVAPGKIHLVGNSMIDSLLAMKPRLAPRPLIERFALQGKTFGFITLHRPSNVDNKPVLSGICAALAKIEKHTSLVWPLHPRTRRMLELHGLAGELGLMTNLHLSEPMSYLDSMSLMSSASFVLTDSGGIQEETTALGIPCLTLRENTERPITITEGTNELVGVVPSTIVTKTLDIIQGNRKRGNIPALWDGKASERIVQILLKEFLW